MNSFEELEAWKLARQIKIEIRELTNHFPSEEKYKLIDQIIRSSRSIGANIAEGFGRFLLVFGFWFLVIYFFLLP